MAQRPVLAVDTMRGDMANEPNRPMRWHERHARGDLSIAVAILLFMLWKAIYP